MVAIPKKRLLVYAAAGLLVLVVGAAGLIAARPSAAVQTDVIALELPGAVDAAGGPAEPSGGGAGDVSPAGSGALASNTTVTEGVPIFVQVAGAVLRPGVYQLPADTRAFQAVMQAGGFAPDADQEAVPLASRLSDGCRLYVPRLGEAAPGPVLSGDTSASAGGSGSAGPVRLNSATAEQLDTLPGIGPALAQRIITYRETEGPFTSVDQLAEVPGIGASKLEQLRPLVTP